MEAPGKRGRPEVANGGAPDAKRPKELDSFQTGLGSKSKPCTKFFSPAGCPFGEGCHFQHYVPGGYEAVVKTMNLSNPALPPPGRILMDPAVPGTRPPVPTVKLRLCNKYNTAEGCKFGEKCHFAHGERELGKPILVSQDAAIAPPMGAGLGGHLGPLFPGARGPGSFGALATAKISVDASLAGAIIGKGSINTKHICQLTGAKLAIWDNESDPNLKNIELEGTFDQIKQASSMVRELIVSISAAAAAPPVPVKNPVAPMVPHGGPGSNYKTKLCDNFTKGTCTFGDRCHFAHGAGELRKGAA